MSDTKTVAWTGYALARATVPSKHMSELKTYTLSNGRKIEIRRVSIYTLELAVKGIPKPKPPVQIVEGVEEENSMHPDYLDALTAHRNAERDARINAIYACGVKAPFGDTEKAEVADFREMAKAAGLADPGPNDWLVYVKHILLNTDKDFMDVQKLVMEGSLPTEEVISQVADTFKSGVEETPNP